MIPIILLFAGICFFGFGDCDDVKVDHDIDFLEYGSTIKFVQFNDTTHSFDSEFPERFTNSEWTIENIGKSGMVKSLASVGSFNSVDYFRVSYWNSDTGSFQVIGDYDIDGNRANVITGLHPVSDKCLNRGICFDSKTDTVYYLIKVLNKDVEVKADLLKQYNARVKEVIRLENPDFVIVSLDMTDLMPKKESDHHFLPWFYFYIPFELKSKDPCFWDNDIRVCHLEQRVLAIEKQMKPTVSGMSK